MTRSRTQPDDAQAGMLDVKRRAIDELTVGLRVPSREVYRPGRVSGFLATHCARLHGSELRAGWLRLTHKAPKIVWLDRQDAAGGAHRSSASASDSATRRVALTVADHDARGSVGTSVAAPECASSELNAMAQFDADRTDGVPNV